MLFVEICLSPRDFGSNGSLTSRSLLVERDAMAVYSQENVDDHCVCEVYAR
jgi:hypothetical protein